MPHPAFPQRAQHRGFGVALHGIEHVAIERGGEGLRGGGDHRRADAVQGLFRPQGFHHAGDIRQGLRLRAQGDVTVQRADRRAVLNQAHFVESSQNATGRNYPGHCSKTR